MVPHKQKVIGSEGQQEQEEIDYHVGLLQRIGSDVHNFQELKLSVNVANKLTVAAVTATLTAENCITKLALLLFCASKEKGYWATSCKSKAVWAVHKVAMLAMLVRPSIINSVQRT